MNEPRTRRTSSAQLFSINPQLQWAHHLNPQRIPSMTSPAHTPSPGSFPLEELKRSLGEQSYGIHSYEILPSTSPHQTSAAVVLFEGDKITVSLSTRGYKIESHKGLRTPPNGVIYESIEALLQSVSKLYIQRREEQLVRALEKLL